MLPDIVKVPVPSFAKAPAPTPIVPLIVVFPAPPIVSPTEP